MYFQLSPLFNCTLVDVLKIGNLKAQKHTNVKKTDARKVIGNCSSSTCVGDQELPERMIYGLAKMKQHEKL